MSQSYNPHDDRRGCVDALHIPLDSITNADMDGIGVVVANVAIVVCLRILMIVKISPMDIDVVVQASLIQSYLILLSTLLSINRQQLSLFDANYALIITSSPLTINLVAASIYELFGPKTNLYKRIKSYRRIIRAFAALLPFIWLALSVTLRLSDRAFKDSQLCRGSSFKDWFLGFLRFLLELVIGRTIPTYISLSLLGPMLLFCLWKKRLRLIAEVRVRRRKASTPLCISRVLVKYAWNDENFRSFFFGYLDGAWVVRVISTAIHASGKGYVLSYGQVLSLAAATPTLISTIRFISSDIRGSSHSRKRPRTPWLAPMLFPTTGNELDPHTQGSHLPFNVTSYPGKPNLGELRDKITTSVRLTNQSTLLPELNPTVWSGWGQDTRPCTSCAKLADTVYGRV